MAQGVHIALHARHGGLRESEAFAGLDGLGPVAELSVGQPARECYPVIAAGEFDLPGATPGQLSAPQDACLYILDRGKGKPSLRGLGAELAKPFDASADAQPRWFHVQVFQDIGAEPTLRAPATAKTMEGKTIRSIIWVKRRDSSQ